MIKKSVVIIADSYPTASWAVNYCRKHKSKNVKILGLSFSAQVCLKENNLSPFNFFSVAKFPEEISFSYHREVNKKSYSAQARRLLDDLIENCEKAKIEYNNYPIIKILELYFFSSFIDILRAHQAVENMVKKWHPDQYFLPKNHKSPLQKYLESQKSEKRKIIFYEEEKNLYKEIVSKIKSDLNFFIERIIPLIKVVSKITNLKIKKLFHIRNEKIEIIFHSFGENLSFYNSFFKLINKKKLLSKFLIISNKQTLKTLEKLDLNTLNFQSSNKLVRQRQKLVIENEAKKILRVINKESNKLKNKLWVKRPKKLKEMLFRSFEEITKNNLEKIIKELYIAEKSLKKLRPKLLITTSDPGPYALSYVYPAEKLGIKTLVLLHGLFVDVEKTKSKSKYYGVWGSLTKKWFVKNINKNPNQLFEIGFPLFDNYFQKNKAFWQENRSTQKIKTPVTIGLILSPLTHIPPDPYIGRFLLEIFSQFDKYYKNYQFIIRAHPYHKINDLERIKKPYKLKISDKTYESIECFLKESDIVLSLNTTAILWPLLYGKSLIHTTVFWGKGIFPTDYFKAAWQVDNSQSLFELVEKIRRSKKFAYSKRAGQQRFLNEVLGPLDGKASERLLRLINDLISKPNKL